MKDYFDELDREIDSLSTISQKKDDIINTHIILNEGLDGTIENIEKEKKVLNNFNKKSKNKNIKINNNQNLSDGSTEIRGKFISKFPETKFYLPTLRDGYTRYIPIGGNNETGAKNMGMVQYKNDILLIDCGVQFPDSDMLGVNYSVPDVSFLTKYKKNIKGFLITHAHLDHIGSLKHIYPALGCPVLYGTRFTIGLVKKQLEEAGVLDKATLIEVDAGKKEMLKIGEFKVEYFKVNHSVPDCAGLYIESPSGTKIVHTGDFKIDFSPAIDEPADLDRIAEIGKRGISLLMSDSTGSVRKGFSMSEKNVGEELEKIVANHTRGRLIIAIFASWISRVQQLIDIASKHGKTIFLSGRSMVENVSIAKDLGYLKIKPGVVRKMTPKNVEGIPPHKQIIITTGSQGEQFSALARMAEGKHNAVEIIRGDTIVFSSSVVPGNEKSVVSIINKLIRLGANVITKDDGEVHTGGHAFQEEQKIMLNLVKPKYFMPVFGDLYFRTLHRNTAISIGMKDSDILMLDNGNIVDFAPNNGNVFKSKIKVPIQEIIIDGHGMGLATSHVLKAREKMMNSGVLVLLFKVDKKTKAIMGHIKLESRGLVYLDEVRNIHRAIIKKAREVYENTIVDVPDMDEKDIIKIVKADLEKFLLQKIDREPMIIPIIAEI
ncbi:ribonuclease J [Candidatus Gracilibacteria bacterium]|nr:MAG: ribonuclease J [Candidatus Gracilibacteria bacterium]